MELGYSSLFRFVVEELGHSESEALKRIQIARVAARFPKMFDLISENKMSLSALSLLCPHLDPTNFDSLTTQCSGKTVRKVEEILAIQFIDCGSQLAKAHAHQFILGTTRDCLAPVLQFPFRMHLLWIAPLIVWGLSLVLQKFFRYRFSNLLRRIRFQNRPWLRHRVRSLSVVLFFLTILAVLLTKILLDRPIIGLFVLFLLPPLGATLLSIFRRVQIGASERSAVAALYTVKGLMEAGLSLPQALFEVAHAQENCFSHALEPHLLKFDKGRSLSQCLARFRTTYSTHRASAILLAMELAYRDGLPALPILETTLPFLEEEIHSVRRIFQVKTTAVCQALFAAFIPWGFGGVLFIFEPAVIHGFHQSSIFVPVIVATFLYEILGILCIFRTSKFL